MHNTLMLEGIEKAVMRHRSPSMPKPSYFPFTHRSARVLMQRMTALEEKTRAGPECRRYWRAAMRADAPSTTSA